MIDPNDWDLTEEFRWLPISYVTSDRDTTAAHPSALEVPLYPVEARFIILQSMIAIWMPIIFFAGSLLHASRFLPEIIIGSILVAFLYGLFSYRLKINERAMIMQEMPALREADILPAPSLIGMVVVPCFTWPLYVTAVSVYAIWSGNHFVAIFLPAFLCFYAFYLYGAKPVQFWQEFLMAQPEVDPADRKFRPRGHGTPDFRLLLIILFILLTSPILLSSAHTYGLVASVLAVTLIVKIRRVGHRQPISLLVYLLKRCHYLLHVYLDQRDAFTGEEGREWITPSVRGTRFLIFLVLNSAVFAVLITGLTYYCPWEFFAHMFVPGFKTGFLLTHTSEPNYGWLIEPFRIAVKAEPVAGYLFTFVAAIAGFLLFPPTLLFALYFERLIGLEFLNQDIKATRRSFEL